VTKDKWIPLDEALDQLENNQQYQEGLRRANAQEEENLRRYHAAAEGLLADLSAAGFNVSNMRELRQVGDKRAIPILVAWLPRVDYLSLKQDMLNALGNRWARPHAARPLIDAFRSADPATDPDWGVRWAAGNSLMYVADESVVDDLVSIARDQRHGGTRALAVAALGNMRKAREKALPVLLEQLDDDNDSVRVGAIMGLGKLKAPEAWPALERLLNDPNPEVRRRAKQALNRLPAA